MFPHKRRVYEGSKLLRLYLSMLAMWAEFDRSSCTKYKAIQLPTKLSETIDRLCLIRGILIRSHEGDNDDT